ncbi:beta-lactamase [Hyphomicrobium nitrativorans NL23]|uniref:Beta-lactamase n=1 Tax=Hyphomicrobium nitrativorans NL23 TaxID=1029756 RepID=V5SE24_9HYPH|nr:beta-lactamase [Hyphomicrobium nitrativorans NL23]
MRSSLAGKSPSSHLDRRRLLTALAALPVGGFLASVGSAAFAATKPVSLVPSLSRPIAAAGQTGVLVFELENGDIGVSDRARAERGFLPASTFKIPNTLIALETGVADSLDAPVFRWDGKERGFSGQPVAAWNRDQPLRDAFRNSAVWVYQDVARRIGRERMQQFVDKMGYGNCDLSGAAIDAFWLTGKLRISALEQIRFLDELRAKRLAVSERAQTLVHEVMEVERTSDYVLRGKTGWADEIALGWFVGWIESGKGSRLFVLNIDMANAASAQSRVEIVKSAARDLHLI